MTSYDVWRLSARQAPALSSKANDPAQFLVQHHVPSHGPQYSTVQYSTEIRSKTSSRTLGWYHLPEMTMMRLYRSPPVGRGELWPIYRFKWQTGGRNVSPDSASLVWAGSGVWKVDTALKSLR